MVLDLFPAVAHGTVLAVGTAFLVVGQELVALPVGTLPHLVVFLLGLAPVVLPVVAVLALAAVVFELVERTEHRLEVEHVEVGVFLHGVDQRHRHFLDVVREGTVDAVVTLRHPVRELLAELAFVLVGPVEHFDVVVRVDAEFSVGTGLAAHQVRTHFR